MLSGQAVVAIWNGITEAGRAEFYAWHVTEHVPERVSIPGFLRGRRYRAIDGKTHPEFFTLYEVESFEVTTSKGYMDRLNTPTPWTKTATAAFRDTSRGAARVLASAGPGSGGILATVRFNVTPDQEKPARSALTDLMPAIAHLPMVTGAHLAATDTDVSRIKTVESKSRTDVQAPPSWFVLIEACTPDSLEVPLRAIVESGFIQNPNVGRYTLEYSRLKTDQAPG
jgi:hypothetical protein